MRLTAFHSCEMIDQSASRLTDDVITSTELNKSNWTVKSVVNILVIKSPFSETDFKEVVEYSLTVSQTIASGGVEKNRAEPGSKRSCHQSDEHFSRRQWRSQFKSRITSRWQSVKHWKSTSTTRSSEDSGSTTRSASSWDDHRFRIDPSISCVHCLWLEPSLDWTILENI